MNSKPSRESDPRAEKRRREIAEHRAKKAASPEKWAWLSVKGNEVTVFPTQRAWNEALATKRASASRKA